MILFIIICFIMAIFVIAGANNIELDSRCKIGSAGKYVYRYSREFLITLITFVFFCVLTGMRAESVGNDTHVYLDLYSYIYRNGIDTNIFLELGYQYYNLIIAKIFNGNQQAFLMVTSIICYSGIAWHIYKRSKNFYLSTCLTFVCCFSFYTNAIRQAMAMTLGLFAYDCLNQKKYIKTVLLIIIASLFHSTAFALLLLLFHKFFPKKTKYVVAIALLLLAVSVVGGGTNIILAIFPRYGNYFGETSRQGSGWLALSKGMIQAIVFYYFAYKAYKSDRESYSLALANFQLVLYFTCFGFNMNLISRVSEFFVLNTIIEIPNVFYKLEISNKKLWLKILCFVLILYFLTVLIFRPEWNQLIPYILWGGE